MSLLPLEDLAAALVDIPSVTGQEGALARHLSGLLEGLGHDVQWLEVAPGRANLLATPRHEPLTVVMCTHLDTVPEFIPARLDATHLWGRGACDTKGLLAAMLHASVQLRARGVPGVGFLLLVGEEVDHCGALAARGLLPRGLPCIVGEPTEGVLASAQKGLLKVRLAARGRAGHSGYPATGESAVHALVTALSRLLAFAWPSTAAFGSTTLNIGLIEGGVAANVFAPSAAATLLLRLGVPRREALAAITAQVGDPSIEIRELGGTDPVQLATLPGVATACVAFNTDIPYLAHEPAYLFGPGSILLAHSAGERIGLEELRAGVPAYVALVERILAERR